MIQNLIVYLIVAVAAGWTAWSMFLRGWLARRRLASAKTGDRKGDCGPDCGCGD